MTIQILLAILIYTIDGYDVTNNIYDIADPQSDVFLLTGDIHLCTKAIVLDIPDYKEKVCILNTLQHIVGDDD